MDDPSCDCCEGTQVLTPVTIANRPGLAALAYRVGTHARFFETMKANLSSQIVEMPRADDATQSDNVNPLSNLATRAPDDPAIALLDGWATVADVLTFYQERIANEGYLRTATERRSVLELARLVGYALRPGVASTVYLAYTLDTNQTTPVEIPVGARSQSLPGPGELPQSFETSDVLDARAGWNTLNPRLTQPQTYDRISSNHQLYLKGVATNLKPNDPVLIVVGGVPQLFDSVKAVQPDLDNDRTLITLQSLPKTASKATNPAGDELLNVIEGLSVPPSVPPSNTLQLTRSVKQSFAINADAGLQVVNALRPDFKAILPVAWTNVQVTPTSTLEVYLLRAKTGVYGSTASRKSILDDKGRVINTVEWPLDSTEIFSVVLTVGNVGTTKSALLKLTPLAATENQILAEVSVRSGNENYSQQVPLAPAEFKLNDKFTIIIKPITINGQNGWHFEVKELGHFIDLGDTDLGVQVNATYHGQLIARQIVFGQNLREATDLRDVSISYDFESTPAGRLGTVVFSVADETPLPPSSRNVIALDGTYDTIAPQTYYVVQRPNHADVMGTITNAQTVARTDYNFPAKVTQLTLDQPWLDNSDALWPDYPDLLLSAVRSTTVFAQSEKLELAEEPIADEICGGADDEIELDDLYSDLKSGRWLIVAGNRSDIKDTNNNVVADLHTAELVMLAGVRHGYHPDLPGDKTHTFITLATKLSYCYQRDQVTIYGNVVKATHGEARNEILGNGDGSRALQSFDLKQPPLTYVAAPNPSGVDSTLQVYVNDVAWHEADALAGLAPADHKFITRTNDEGKTTVIFGNGRQGARLPTGTANVRAVYRNGIGKPGNVQAGQISLLVTRPLGVKGVFNPLRASGGADKESRDQARKNVPLAVAALDRLVSIQDYADFTRTFAGIAKASARRASDGHRELVHITIAGVDDVPIDPPSDLYRNLLTALHDYGDPDLPVQVDLRELLMLVIEAKLYLQADHVWEKVVSDVKTKLLDTFSFDRRELGQDAVLSEMIAVMQAVPGVAYVDVDLFDAIPERITDATTGQRRLRTPQEITEIVQGMAPPPRDRIRVDLSDAPGSVLQPAQLAFLSPLVPDTLILNRG